jgi:hypothetical protein
MQEIAFHGFKFQKLFWTPIVMQPPLGKPPPPLTKYEIRPAPAETLNHFSLRYG